MKKTIFIFALILTMTSTSLVFAHGEHLDEAGCSLNKETNVYHCH